MTIYQLFTTYWSQVTLLLALISYFVQRIFDIKTKKQEINHSLFQQKKLASLDLFLEVYSKTEQVWNHLRVFEIMRNKFTANEIDEMIFPNLNELQKVVHILQIYFDVNDYKKFVEILNNVKSINLKLSKIYFNLDEVINMTILLNDFSAFKGEMLAKNEIIITQITTNIKKTFK